jgi:hypothetical protein
VGGGQRARALTVAGRSGKELRRVIVAGGVEGLEGGQRKGPRNGLPMIKLHVS